MWVTVLFFMVACMKGKSVDLIVHNAKIHTLDEQNTVADAMAIRDGEIIEIGPERQIMNKYSADEYLDAEQKEVFPGLTDAHGHLMSYARAKLSVDLFGTTSMDDLLVRVEKYDQQKKHGFILGRGWDQSLWGTNELPSNERLTELFPDKPVVLHRVDGHAVLVNQKALDLAGIGPDTKIAGGSVLVKDGKCTGLLLDNAITQVTKPLPDFKQTELVAALKEVQSELLQYGITGVHEAGVTYEDMQLLRSLSRKGVLRLDVYVMLFPSEQNIAFAKQNGVVEESHFVVRSFKVMGDGALGSHGAYMKQPYTDDVHTSGLLTTTPEEMKRIAGIALTSGYQLNVHAIGDSTNRIVLDLVKEVQAQHKDHRWRIEHAQVIDPADFALFAETGVIPSVQPTHAVSDQRWAEMRLGKKRMKGAYAYQSLLNQTGILAIGTDFPVEYPNPFLTLHAAVNRTNAEGEPIGGFLSGEALSVDDCLKGMTLWAAMAAFQEHRLGTLEKRKEATFVILSFPFKVQETFESNYAHKVFIKGKEVYSAE